MLFHLTKDIFLSLPYLYFKPLDVLCTHWLLSHQPVKWPSFNSYKQASIGSYDCSNHQHIDFNNCCLLVSAVYKDPDVHIYDNQENLEFAMLYNDVIYSAKWNTEQFNKDQFKENGTISFDLENWFFLQGRRWIKRRSIFQQGRPDPPFQILDKDYDNGNVTFKQAINKPIRFQFDISLVVLLKKTRNLNILYTSTILSFVPKGFSDQAGILEYCTLWLNDLSNTAVQRDNLQNCPCTLTSVRLDPDFTTDPTCSSSSSKCHENVKTENVEATHCYIKNVDKMYVSD